jgi:hypothetical protein
VCGQLNWISSCSIHAALLLFDYSLGFSSELDVVANVATKQLRCKLSALCGRQCTMAPVIGCCDCWIDYSFALITTICLSL